MLKRALGALALACATLSLVACAPQAPKVQGITSIAVLGDSISQASTTCQTLVNCPENSWATGSNPEVNSVLQRIEAEEKTTVTAYNDSVVGARMADLQAQSQAAITQQPDIVFILAGSNDYCAPSTDTMTATVDYQQQVTQVLANLNTTLPNARIHVSSVPSPLSLYNALKNNVRAQQVWAVTGSCRSLLESPQDTSPAAVARRQLVADRANEYDSALQQACAVAARCHYDGGAITGQHITEADVSNVDFFHPSLQGQHQLADLAWGKGGLQQFLASASASLKTSG